MSVGWTIWIQNIQSFHKAYRAAPIEWKIFLVWKSLLAWRALLSLYQRFTSDAWTFNISRNCRNFSTANTYQSTFHWLIYTKFILSLLLQNCKLLLLINYFPRSSVEQCSSLHQEYDFDRGFTFNGNRHGMDAYGFYKLYRVASDASLGTKQFHHKKLLKLVNLINGQMEKRIRRM